MAGHVTEVEIIDQMTTSFRIAAECCDDLATLPSRGPCYDRLRKELALLEGCCRQLAYYRDNDARWLSAGMAMAEVHKRAGGWLRTIPRTATDNAAHPLFVKLGEQMRGMHAKAVEMQTQRTGRIGAILPKPQRLDRMQGRPMQVRLPSGLIVPREWAA
jgi:hypothetical protein